VRRDDNGEADLADGCVSSRMGCLLDALDRGYRVLGLDEAAGGDGVFRPPVLARIIAPASKIDSFEPTQAGNVGSAACAS
jgi:hypothetical protein